MLDIRVRPRVSRSEVQELLESWAESNGADVRPMGRLVRRYKTKGENMHWHIAGRGKGMGTVEVSYFPSTGRLTVLVHDNRRGSWAGNAYESLAREINKKENIST